MQAVQLNFHGERFINLKQCRAGLSPKEIRGLCRKARTIAADSQQKEIELINVLEELDSTKAYRISGLNSLFSYSVEVLRLSENQTLTYITLARKCSEVPAMRSALFAKDISVSKARRLCSVINPSNEADWIELAKKSNSKELDKAIRKKVPRAMVYDSLRYLTEDFLNLSATIDEDTAKKMNRVKEVMMSHKTGRLDYNTILKEIADFYLDRKDPVRRAKRSFSKAKIKGNIISDANSISEMRVDSSDRRPLSAALKNFILIRDRGECRFHRNGKRC